MINKVLSVALALWVTIVFTLLKIAFISNEFSICFPVFTVHSIATEPLSRNSFVSCNFLTRECVSDSIAILSPELSILSSLYPEDNDI